MRQWLRSHLTYANVMVTLLVFLVLGGGAYAGSTCLKTASGRGTSSMAQVKKPDLADAAVTARKLETPARFKDVGLPDSPRGNVDR